MYSDLFDALGGGGVGGGGGNRSLSNARTNGSTASEEQPPLLSFNAGKMELALQENSNYWVTPDTRRCQVNLKYNDESNLVWEWYDRREKKVMDTIQISNPVKLIKADVPPTQDSDSNDRVYYWKLDSEWRMIWLQDKEEDPELIDKANQILKHPIKPAEIADTSGTGGALASPDGDGSTSSVSVTTRQVDALSSILENLGMPQGGAEQMDALGTPTSASPNAASASGATSLGGGTLTLADLQGAISGVQKQQETIHPPGLQDIVTPDAIQSLLDNESVRDRLLEQLPEEQRTPEFLEENLRSPQVQQTLRSLTSALMPDDNGSLDGYHSVLANFQLDAADGLNALSGGQSPIQAFLDCVLASVQREKDNEDNIHNNNPIDEAGPTSKKEEDSDDKMEEEE